MFLNNTQIKNAKPKAKQYKISDGEGLYLLVHPNGSKYWQFKYIFAEKSRILSIGKYPLVTLAKAREKRLEAQRLLLDNTDPNAHKKKEKALATFKDRNTFLAVAEEWHERNKGVWSQGYVIEVWGRLENHILPQLGKRAIADIEPVELLEVIQKIERRGKTDMSHRVLRICGSIFTYAIVTRRAQHNIALGLSKALKPHRGTNYPTITEQELPDFLAALGNLSTSEQNKLAFKLLLLTALRTGEMRHSKWSDINLETREWRIRAEITKMRTEHVVPLSKQVIKLLIKLHPITGESKWLFPSQQSRVHEVMSENTITHMIHRMGYKGKIVGHGFRSLFSTVLNERGFNPDAIERQLAHMERNKVRAAYNRATYMEERCEIMQWWADWLDSCKLKTKNILPSKFIQPFNSQINLH